MITLTSNINCFLSSLPEAIFSGNLSICVHTHYFLPFIVHNFAALRIVKMMHFTIGLAYSLGMLQNYAYGVLLVA